MNLAGSVISFPPRVDARGSIVATAKREEIITQAIRDIIETRRGERVMMPDYGIPDFVFAVANAAFVHKFAYHLERQVRAYVPLVRSVNVEASTNDEGKIEIRLRWQEAGSVNAPGNMVYPVWRLIDATA